MYKIIGGDQREYGPVDFNSVLDWIRQGRANAQTLVQKEGGAWVPLGSLAEFAEALAAQAAATPAPAGTGPAMPPPVPDAVGDRRVALQAVQGPATGLLVTGIIGALFALGNLVMALLGAGGPRPDPNDVPEEMRQFVELMLQLQNPAVAIGSSVFGLAIAALIIVAGQKLRRLESFALVASGTILAMIPCLSPCCCIGLPIGIWVLTVILKPDVKMSFR